MFRAIWILSIFIPMQLFASDYFILDLAGNELYIYGKKKELFLEIYKEPDSASKIIGKIKITIGKYNAQSYFIDEAGNEQSDQADIHQGLCGGRAIVLHSSREEKNGFYKIPMKFSDDMGWIKSKAHKLSDPKGSFPVSLYLPDGKEDKSFTVNNIYNSNGQLELKAYCSSVDEIKNLTPFIKKDSKKIEEPYFVDFLEGTSKDLEPKSCWGPEGKFLENECEMEVSKCFSEEKHENIHKVDLKIYPSELLIKRNGGVDIYVRGINNQGSFSNVNTSKIPWTTGTKVPIGSEIIFFDSFMRESFSLFWRGAVPEDGIIKITELKPAYKTVKFFMKDPYHLELSGKIFDEYLGLLSKEKSLEISLPEGDFDIEFTAFDNEKNVGLIKTINLSIPKPSGAMLIDSVLLEIEISGEQLEVVKSSLPNYVRMYARDMAENSHMQSPISIGYSESESSGQAILGLDKFQIKENNFSIIDLFKIYEGKLELIKHSEYFKGVRNLPVFTMEFSGTCGKFNRKTLLRTEEIYSAPNVTSEKLGKLQIFDDKDGIVGRFNSAAGGKQLVFKTNMYTGYCGTSSLQNMLHQIKKIEGEFVDLGQGPWGDSGWVKMKAYGLFSDPPIDFEWLSDRNWVRFKKDKDNNIFAVGNNSIGSPEGDIVSDELKIPVNYEDLFDESGKIRLEVNCSYGC